MREQIANGNSEFQMLCLGEHHALQLVVNNPELMFKKNVSVEQRGLRLVEQRALPLYRTRLGDIDWFGFQTNDTMV